MDEERLNDTVSELPKSVQGNNSIELNYSVEKTESTEIGSTELNNSDEKTESTELTEFQQFNRATTEFQQNQQSSTELFNSFEKTESTVIGSTELNNSDEKTESTELTELQQFNKTTTEFQRNQQSLTELFNSVEKTELAENNSVTSNCMTFIENTAKSEALQQSQPVSKESNYCVETDGTDQVKGNSSTDGVEPVLEGPQNLDKLNNTLNSAGKDSVSNGNLSKAVVKISRPLCADYRSGSDTESLDSESDSSTSSDTFSESEDEADDNHDSDGEDDRTEKQKEKKLQRDFSLSDLPPIEDLKISVPENACVEVGKISGIVDTLVVVESYKGTAALDVDTVLFLDCGKRTLGKVFDILGPITEPVYTVRFNSQDQIKSLNIEKEQKVYYAPKTPHTMFVFLAEVLKNKGSDASWKDNIEAPSEFQDFSDDEEERQHKDQRKRDGEGESTCFKEANKSRKRSFSRTKPTSGVLQPSRFRHPGPSAPRFPSFPRNPSLVPPSAYPTPVISNPAQAPVFPYNIPPYPGTNAFAPTPHLYYPPRFSGPAFPPFGGLPFVHPQQPLHHPFYQQRSHGFRQPPVTPFGMWGRPMFRPPPPPPPPPDGQENLERPNGKAT